MRSLDVEHVGNRHDAGHAQHFARVITVRTRIDDHEAAAPGVVLTHEGETGGRLIVAFDDHVFEQLAQAGFDRALVAAIDFHVVGHGTLLTDVAVGLHQHHAGRIAEISPARGQLLQRRQPRLDGGQFLFSSADLTRPLFVLAARAGQLRLSRGVLEPDRLERRPVRGSTPPSQPCDPRPRAPVHAGDRPPRRRACPSVSPTRSCCAAVCSST